LFGNRWLKRRLQIAPEVQAIFGPPPPPADKATDRRYAADLGPANMFNRHFGGRPSIAFTRHM